MASAVTVSGTTPFMNLARVLPELSGDKEAIEQFLRIEETRHCHLDLRSWKQRHDRVSVIVDQFEELFTLNHSEVQQLLLSS